jgi:hypothetical protein
MAHSINANVVHRWRQIARERAPGAATQQPPRRRARLGALRQHQPLELAIVTVAPAWRLAWCPPTSFGGHHPGRPAQPAQADLAGRLRPIASRAHSTAGLLVWGRGWLDKDSIKQPERHLCIWSTHVNCSAVSELSSDLKECFWLDHIPVFAVCAFGEVAHHLLNDHRMLPSARSQSLAD